VWQSADRNSEQGDVKAAYHSYNVLLLHLAETVDAFSLCDTDRPEKVLRYTTQPDFKTDCADFAAISDAPAAMMEYLLALQRFVVAARPIEPHRKVVQKSRAFMKARQGV
jgi:hypothetical protein